MKKDPLALEYVLLLQIRHLFRSLNGNGSMCSSFEGSQESKNDVRDTYKTEWFTHHKTQEVRNSGNISHCSNPEVRIRKKCSLNLRLL